ncbi:MAG: type II toxin-antitoxin system VapC family toxin [Chitinophagaceae bacterium]|jgi:predicted nucleic acid-binding protein|nr:type II toxin-antitoxin system VapC family toxin [Chitinophagaceae bacterium]
MKTLLDSTAIIHLSKHSNKMRDVFACYNIHETSITRINYLEILAGSAENAKIEVRKFLHQFPILEFDKKSYDIANRLAFKYRIGNKQKVDFLIASIAIANKLPLLTENDKDFQFKEIKLLPYKISS